MGPAPGVGDPSPSPRAALPVPRAIAGRAARPDECSSSGRTSTCAGRPAFAHGTPLADHLRAPAHLPPPSCAGRSMTSGRGRALVVQRASPRHPLLRPISPVGHRSRRISTSEVRTLLSGYLLSSCRGIAMLMRRTAIEGRLRFLDVEASGARVVECPPAYKLAVLDEIASSSARRRGAGATRHPAAPEAALPRARRPQLRRSERARMGPRDDERGRRPRRRGLRSDRGLRPLEQVPGAGADSGPFPPTPTTWRGDRRPLHAAPPA